MLATHFQHASERRSTSTRAIVDRKGSSISAYQGEPRLIGEDFLNTALPTYTYGSILSYVVDDVVVREQRPQTKSKISDHRADYRLVLASLSIINRFALFGGP